MKRMNRINVYLVIECKFRRILFHPDILSFGYHFMHFSRHLEIINEVSMRTENCEQRELTQWFEFRLRQQ